MIRNSNTTTRSNGPITTIAYDAKGNLFTITDADIRVATLMNEADLMPWRVLIRWTVMPPIL